MKKIIILIVTMCCFGWCNCTLEKIFKHTNDKTFRFKCKTPFEYTDEYEIDSTIYFVETSYKVISTQQCNYHNGDVHCINIETNDDLNCDGSCRIDIVIDKFGIYLDEKITYLDSTSAAKETLKLWNNLKKYIPFKNNKINFPITKRK